MRIFTFHSWNAGKVLFSGVHVRGSEAVIIVKAGNTAQHERPLLSLLSGNEVSTLYAMFHNMSIN